MSKTDKQIQALKKASQDKRVNTQLKVTTVLRVMKEKNLPINFESVAKLAGVSKTWLYRQAELSEEISSSRNKTSKIKRVIDLQSINEKKNAEITTLKNKNKLLKLTIKKLRHQMEVVYGELYKLKQDIRS